MLKQKNINIILDPNAWALPETHMKWEVHLALGNAEYIFLGKQDSEHNIWKNQNFGNTNMYNETESNKAYTGQKST